MLSLGTYFKEKLVRFVGEFVGERHMSQGWLQVLGPGSWRDQVALEGDGKAGSRWGGVGGGGTRWNKVAQRGTRIVEDSISTAKGRGGVGS